MSFLNETFDKNVWNKYYDILISKYDIKTGYEQMSDNQFQYLFLLMYIIRHIAQYFFLFYDIIRLSIKNCIRYK